MENVATITFEAKTAISEELYESAFPVVGAWVRKMNGSLEDAKDVFHDALVLYQEKKNRGITINVNPEAYILGIAKHLWLRKFKVSANLVCLDDVEQRIVGVRIINKDLELSLRGHGFETARYLRRAR